MSPIVTAVLTVAAEAFLGSLAGSIAEDLYKKLQRDPSKQAYKRALGAAVQRYATGQRLSLARPLLAKKGILADKEVAAELSQLLRFERKPDVDKIGEIWRSALHQPPRFHDFAEEAMLLVGYLENELRSSEVFRPVFEAQDLNAISVGVEEATESLVTIEGQLDGLAALLDARFGELTQAFLGASFGIRDQIRDYARYIEEKTRGFVGRKWVFDAVDDFMKSNPRGYFFILGDPGIGKSALAAQLVKQKGHLHHFNIRAEGINKASTFLKNMCAQLIAAYGLSHSVLPPEATDDAGFLNKLLGQVSDRLGAGERCVMVVDALDEVDTTGMPAGANYLYLPQTLPPGVYLVVTLRDQPDILPRVTCEQGELAIVHDSSDNLDDVRDYLTASTARPGVQAYLAAHDISPSSFVDHLLLKSEGNFMYLRYVLPEIERGVYQDLALGEIPAGLQNYYQDHWRRMRGMDEEAWFEYKLPILVALSVVREAVSVDLIADFAKVESRRRIRAVLSEWTAFLHEEQVEYEGSLQRRFRLYHASFFDFIAGRQEVADEQVDLKAMHGQIADTLWDDLFGEE